MGIDRHYRARTRGSSVGTVIGIALVLFMLGVLGFLVLNARALERYFREQVRMDVYLKQGLAEVEVMRLQKSLGTEPFIRATTHVTPEEAAARLTEDLGEDFLGVLGHNPLLSSIELHLDPAYARPDSLRWIAEHLQRDPRVQEVAYNATVVEDVERNMNRMGLVVVGFTVLLLVIAIALINNTIRLAIYSRRFLIRTMHLVGATAWFIKRPFLSASLWQGLVGAALAVGLLAGGVQLLHRRMPDLLAITSPLELAALFGAVVVLGLLLALLSTWFAVGRYLRMRSDDLHWS